MQKTNFQGGKSGENPWFPALFPGVDTIGGENGDPVVTLLSRGSRLQMSVVYFGTSPWEAEERAALHFRGAAFQIELKQFNLKIV